MKNRIARMVAALLVIGGIGAVVAPAAVAAPAPAAHVAAPADWWI